MPLAQASPAACGELDVRQDADADDDEVGLVPSAVGHDDRTDVAVVVRQLRDPGAEHQLDAAPPVQVGVEAGDDRGDDAAHQPIRGLEHGHLLAEHAQRRCDLEADEPAADHHDLPGRLGPARELARMVEGPQIEHAVEVRTGHRQGAHAGAGSEHQRVVRYRSARRVDHAPLRTVDRRHRPGEIEFDRLRAIEGRLPEQETRRLHLAEQEPFGQWRTLVGRMRLGADQPDRAWKAVAAQGRGDLEAGLTRAHDHDRRTHRSAPSRPVSVNNVCVPVCIASA